MQLQVRGRIEFGRIKFWVKRRRLIEQPQQALNDVEDISEIP
jgi:hypothetical protein